jgi:hypothetical protein
MELPPFIGLRALIPAADGKAFRRLMSGNGSQLFWSNSMEQWKDVPGYEGRYQVSDLGRVKSLPFLQRYLLRTGVEAFRRTRERILAVHPQNGGYLLAHLYLDNKRVAFTVHGLVARAFIPNPLGLPEVNHIDGVKANCSAANLEWMTRPQNKVHAVDLGLATQAVRVVHPATGEVFPSIARAALEAGCSPKTVRTSWARA